MNYRFGGLVSLGIAAILLFVPSSLCQENPMYPDNATNPQMCVSVPTYQAISLGWQSAQFSLVLAIGLAVLGLYLLGKKEPDAPTSD